MRRTWASMYPIGTKRFRRWCGNGDVRGYRPAKGWDAQAALTDIHPVTGRTLRSAQWWIFETFIGGSDTAGVN